MFKKHNLEIKDILAEKSKNTNWKSTLKYHRLMIKRIQHERLIHLLVTFFVGIVMTIAIFSTILTTNIMLLWFDIPLTILFLAYLIHYRFLENTTQNWYQFEDQIQNRLTIK